jgi:hypothetical protein
MWKRTVIIFCLVAIIALALPIVHAQAFVLTLNIKYKNNLGDMVSIPGNLTLNDAPVTDALVAIEVDNPHNMTLMRTLTTGVTPAEPWLAEILEFYTCDGSGNPKSSFKCNEPFGLKVMVKNNLANKQHVNVTVTLFYSNMAPFFVHDLYNADMDPGATQTTYVYGFTFPIDASKNLGQAYGYASALSGWPKNNGYALCPENSTSFTITSSGGGGAGGGAMQVSGGIDAMSSSGEFNLTFSTNGYGGFTGNYTTTATSLYPLLQLPSYFANVQQKFNVYLIGDNNGDGKVRVDDILYEVQHFGLNGPPFKYPPDPGWDPVCDWTGDGKIRVDDILICVQAYGKYGSP